MDNNDLAEGLLAAIRKEKLAAFDYAHSLSRMTPAELLTCGYRHANPDQAAGQSIVKAAERIEKMIRKFEKENP